MSETVFVALITGGFTLVSGVIGVVLTHRYTRGQAEAVRREERRRDARALVAQFVNAGVQWSRTHDVLIPVYFKAANDTQFWSDWPDTESGRAFRENVQTVERTAGELRLIVSDAELLDALSKALALMADSKAMKAVLEDSKRTNGSTWSDGSLENAFSHYMAAERAFREVETRAASLLRGQL